MKSIRRTLLVSLLGGVVLAAVGCGTLFHQRLLTTLTDQFDAALFAKAQAVAALLELEGVRLEFDFNEELMPEFSRDENPEFFQISLPEGELISRSVTLVRAAQELPLRFGSATEPEFFDLDLPQGQPGRAAGMLVTVRDDGEHDEEAGEAPPVVTVPTAEALSIDVVLVYARPRAELDGTLAALRDAAWLAGGLLVLLVLVVVWVGVQRGLLPIRKLETQVSRIGASSLASRIPAEGLPAELQTMAGKLNELLARLEEAFLRERRMTANVAHELRNPIAELRNATDVALRWPDDESLCRQAIETAQSVSIRMGDLILGLLRLARISNGEAELQPEPVELRELVEQVWAGCETEAHERRLCFEHRTPGGLVLRTDRALLTSALSNLVENAVHHSTAGSIIVCEGSTSNGESVSWTLQNSTDSLEGPDAPRLTEPFWQKDAARSDPGHSGLGLTLVSSIARSLGMTLEFQIDDGFRVTLSGPSRLNGAT